MKKKAKGKKGKKACASKAARPKYYYKVVARRDSDGVMLSIYDGTTEYAINRWTRADKLFVFRSQKATRDSTSPYRWGYKSRLVKGIGSARYFPRNHTIVTLRCVAKGATTHPLATFNKLAFRQVKPVAVLKANAA